MDLFDDLPEPNVTTCLSTTNPKNTSPTKRKSIESDINIKKNRIDLRHIQSYVVERQGERETMQDAHIICNDFGNCILDLDLSLNRLSFYGLFDGHGGSRASQFCADSLHLKIAENFPKGDIKKIEKDMKTCFVNSFTKLDKEFLEKARKEKPSWKDGTTAIVTLIIENTLYIANVGDSKAVLYRKNESSKCLNQILLSKDHSPTMYEERLRIQKAGGTVREGRVMGVLEVSRSIGDGQFKMCGISCIPDVKKCQLNANDRFVVIACDGLWKSFTPQEVASELEEVIQNEDSQSPDAEDQISSRCDQVCIKLANEAVRRGCEDNVTILLLHISS